MQKIVSDKKSFLNFLFFLMITYFFLYGLNIKTDNFHIKINSFLELIKTEK